MLEDPLPAEAPALPARPAPGAARAVASLPPGPRAPRVAQAVMFGLRYPQLSSAARRRFGSTFTIRPGTMPATVLTTDRDAIRRLLTGDPRSSRHANDALRPLIGERSVLLLEPGEHLARRRLLLPPFHGERVRAYGQLMRDLMEDEVARWRVGDAVPILTVAQNVTIEVILQAVLGVVDGTQRARFRRLIDDLLFYPLGSLRLALAARFAAPAGLPASARQVAAFAAALPTPAVMTYFPELKARTWLNPGTVRWWHHRDRLYALLGEHIAATQADACLGERDDVLAMLVQATDENGRALEREALLDECFALIGAGHETTAVAIAWGAALLAHAPAVRERAAAAARKGEDAYVGALAKEVLRMRPPIPASTARRLDESFQIGPHLIPPGTPIGIDAWGVHHDPQIYPDPHRLRPERFLESPPAAYAWLPFGGGARRCLGSALAELEIRVALSVILEQVTIGPTAKRLPPVTRRGVTLVPQGGGRVRVLGRTA